MRRKTIITIALTLTMLLPITAFAGEIKISDWAKEEIASADSVGLIPSNLGITDYTAEIKRDKFCSLACGLMRAEGEDINTDTKNFFDDTDNEDVITLSGLGIIYGKGGSIFAPDDYITREEAAAILCRMADYMNLPEASAEEFTYSDDDYISDWAKPSVYAMREMGIMYGVGNDIFSPHRTYTAEQSVATMLRLYNYAENKGSEPNAEPTPTPVPAPTAKRDAMNEMRYCHMSVTVGDKVYVIGGADENDKVVNNIEVCEGGKNMWSYEGTSEYIVKDAMAAVKGSTIYIIGGERDNETIDDITAYNTETKEWTEIGNMGTPVKSESAVCIENKLYVADRDNILIYDLETGENSKLDYPARLDNIMAVSHNDELYIFSGIGTDNSTYVYSDGKWEKKAAAPGDYSLNEGQSDGDKIYVCAYKADKNNSILEYNTESDTWRVIMDNYIYKAGAYGFTLCQGYAYITGGLTSKLFATDSVEPYYYKWTYADYDADADLSFKKTMGFEYENHDDSITSPMPEITTVNVKELDSENKTYELIAVYTCYDDATEPYFFWETYSGCFDGASPDYRRVIYHADGSSDTVRINVGIGDGSGRTSKRTFTIPINK